MLAATSEVSIMIPPPLTTVTNRRQQSCCLRGITQLSMLLCKNVLLFRRSVRLLLAFLLSPLLAVAIIFIAHKSVRVDSVTQQQKSVQLTYQPCHTTDVYGNIDSPECISIYYATTNGNSHTIQAIMKQTAIRTGLSYGTDIVELANQYELNTILRTKVGRYGAGILFDALSTSIGSSSINCPLTTTPLNISYTLFINTTTTRSDKETDYLTSVSPNVDASALRFRVPAKYFALQHALNLAITDIITATAQGTQVDKQQQVQQPSYLHARQFTMYDGPLGTSSSSYLEKTETVYRQDEAVKMAGAPLITVAVIGLTILVMQLVAAEKQLRTIGLMRIMGLIESYYWWSWILTFVVMGFVAALLATALGATSDMRIFSRADFAIHLIALWLFICSMCALALVITSVVHRPVILNLVGFCIFFIGVVTTIAFGGIDTNNVYRPGSSNVLRGIFWILPWFHYLKIFADLLQLTSSITTTNQSTVTLQTVEMSYHWKMITKSMRIYSGCAYGDENCCLQHRYAKPVYCFSAPSTSSALINLVILSVIYSFLAYYLANVIGASLGRNKKPWFFLIPSFWGFQTPEAKQFARIRAMGTLTPDSTEMRAMLMDPILHEQYLSLQKDEIRTYKLSKAYKQTSALKEVTLQMKTGQVTCLLGSNGAGKSTLINTLTGLLEPTFGHAWLFGHSISDIDAIQSSMGVCMQDDLLFEELTPCETIRLFAALRGIKYGDFQDVVDRKLTQFSMHSFANQLVRNLSGGMKRRLSLLLATIGEPRLIVMDEPSTGMDPENRYAMWQIIRSFKRNTIVILTTHSMDEANQLGDQIAIFNNGRMRALGTAHFLTRRYGFGYTLNLLVHPSAVLKVRELVQTYLPGCEFISTHGKDQQQQEKDGLNGSQHDEEADEEEVKSNGIDQDKLQLLSPPMDSIRHQPKFASTNRSRSLLTPGGNMTIGLKRRNLRSLTAFFAALQTLSETWRIPVVTDANDKSDDRHRHRVSVASASSQPTLLREWSLCHSTLEEVYLRLCAQDQNVNEGVAGSSEDVSKCVLCHTSETVLELELFTRAGRPVQCDELFCAKCSHTNEATNLISGPSMIMMTPIMTPSEGADVMSMASHEVLPTPGDEHQNQMMFDTGSVATPVPTQVAVETLHQPQAAKLHALATAVDIDDEQDDADVEIALAKKAQEQFQERWSEMNKQSPTFLQQVRAVYFKNLSVLQEERYGTIGKFLILIILAILIALQTTSSIEQCPGTGWVLDKIGRSLPCEGYDLMQKFDQNTVSYATDGALDVYDCSSSFSQLMLDPQTGNTSFVSGQKCGTLPKWPVTSYYYQPLILAPFTTDVLTTQSTGGLSRSLIDLPFSSYDLPRPIYQWEQNGINFTVKDRTNDIISSSDPPFPSILNKRLNPWVMSAQQFGTQSTSKSSVSINDLLSPPRRSSENSLSPFLHRVDLYVNGQGARIDVHDLDSLQISASMWLNDQSVPYLPSGCYNYNNRNAYAVVYLNQTLSYPYDDSLILDAWSSLFPSFGVELLKSKPYPLMNGVRQLESSTQQFATEFEYQLSFWDPLKLPSTIFVSTPPVILNGYLQSPCHSLSVSSPTAYSMPFVIHALSNAFFVERMKSLFSNRTDSQPNITFDSHPQLKYYNPTGTNFTPIPPPVNVCPLPGIQAKIIPLPSVLYSQPLTETAIRNGLFLLIFLTLINFPSTVGQLLFERETNILRLIRINGGKPLALWVGLYAYDMSLSCVWFAVLLCFGYGLGSIIFTSTNAGIWILFSLIGSHYLVCSSWLFAACFSTRRLGLVATYSFVAISILVGVVMDQSIDGAWPIGLLFIPPIAWLRCLSTIIRQTPKTITNGPGNVSQLTTVLLIMLFEGTAIGILSVLIDLASDRGWEHLWKSIRRGVGSEQQQQKQVDNHATSNGHIELVQVQQQEVRSVEISKPESTIIDASVTAEEQLVASIIENARSPSDYPPILARHVRKEFNNRVTGTKNVKVAVADLNFHVNAGEVFGLLGSNGAGKSTFLSIMSGTIDATSGTVFACGVELNTSQELLHQRIGICPQFDCVWPNLSVEQHFLFYARLRGVQPNFERALVRYIAQLTNLDGDPMQKPAGSLSGGMRRRLSLGISLIGNPQCWLLDEPTSGLSPEIRRDIWEIIDRRKRGGDGGGMGIHTAIVLTSHDMDEVDTLSDRIGIMCHGQLQCVGSGLALKRQFAKSYTLTITTLDPFLSAEVHNFLFSNNSSSQQQQDLTSISASERATLTSAHRDALMVAISSSTQSPAAAGVSRTSRKLNRMRILVTRQVELLRFISRIWPNSKLTSVESNTLHIRLDDVPVLQSSNNIHPIATPAPIATDDDTSADHRMPTTTSSITSLPSSPPVTIPIDGRNELIPSSILHVCSGLQSLSVTQQTDYNIAEWRIAHPSLDQVFMAVVERAKVHSNP